MKTLLSSATLAIAATVLSANVFAAEPQYKVDVFTLSDSAIVKVTQNGQPVANVPVEVKGFNTHTMKTSESGTAIVRNVDNAAHSLKIKVTEPNGEVFETQRFIAEYN
jgi:hypothetical protein